MLRLRGDYLAIVTLAFGEIIRLVLINWVPVTNGYAGISGIPRPTFFGIPFNASDEGFAAVFGLEFSPIYRTIFLYYMILALALLTAYVTHAPAPAAGRPRLGGAARGRDRLPLARHQHHQHQAHRVRDRAPCSAASPARSSPPARASSRRNPSPSWKSATILAIVVLGGMGSQIGVAIAAVAMIGGTEILRELDFLKQVFGSDFDPTQYRMLLFGLAMVLIMIWKPRGLIAHPRAVGRSCMSARPSRARS